MSPQDRYLDLLKSSLLNELYLENEVRLLYVFAMLSTQQKVEGDVVRDVARRLPDWVQRVREARQDGRPWWALNIAVGGGPAKTLNLRNVCEFSHTMIGRKRLDNIQHCLDTIRRENIAGDVIETGAWRGGAAIFMRGYLAAWEMKDRAVWVADSFEGLPVPSLPQDEGYDFSVARVPILAVSMEEVQENFRRHGLLDDRVRFLKGWFRDTLPTAPVGELALLRLDGDLYESTMDSLEALYDRVVPGGYIIVDDYGDFEPCRRAVHEFRDWRGITDPIEMIDWTGVFWRKSGARSTAKHPSLRDFSNALDNGNLQTIQRGVHQYRWKGVPLRKSPFDFALYWMLVWHAKPRTIIEIGSEFGGSALWFADMLQTLGIEGKVVSIDKTPVTSISDPRIEFLRGDVANLGASLGADYLASLPRPWLVIEDSSHRYEHCLSALEFFHSHLAKDEYLLVEDGVVDDLGASSRFNGGPNRAVREFLENHVEDYAVVTELCDFWGRNVTWNPNGYLRKLR
jgi:cephalosporin hydroxylase